MVVFPTPPPLPNQGPGTTPLTALRRGVLACKVGRTIRPACGLCEDQARGCIWKCLAEPCPLVRAPAWGTRKNSHRTAGQPRWTGTGRVGVLLTSSDASRGRVALKRSSPVLSEDAEPPPYTPPLLLLFLEPHFLERLPGPDLRLPPTPVLQPGLEGCCGVAGARVVPSSWLLSPVVTFQPSPSPWARVPRCTCFHTLTAASLPVVLRTDLGRRVSALPLSPSSRPLFQGCRGCAVHSPDPPAHSGCEGVCKAP